jgi:hypothetical protein
MPLSAYNEPENESGWSRPKGKEKRRIGRWDYRGQGGLSRSEYESLSYRERKKLTKLMERHKWEKAGNKADKWLDKSLEDFEGTFAEVLTDQATEGVDDQGLAQEASADLQSDAVATQFSPPAPGVATQGALRQAMTSQGSPSLEPGPVAAAPPVPGSPVQLGGYLPADTVQIEQDGTIRGSYGNPGGAAVKKPSSPYSEKRNKQYTQALRGALDNYDFEEGVYQGLSLDLADQSNNIPVNRDWNKTG